MIYNPVDPNRFGARILMESIDDEGPASLESPKDNNEMWQPGQNVRDCLRQRIEPQLDAYYKNKERRG